MKQTVLINSCGRRVHLMDCFREDAPALGIELRVLGSDSNVALSSASQKADACFHLPRVDSSEFLPELAALCEREQVDLVIPTIEPGVKALAESESQRLECGTDFVVSSRAAVAISNDKLLSKAFFERAGIRYPKTFSIDEIRSDVGCAHFPVIAKPIGGSASVGIEILENSAELFDSYLDEGYLIQECIPGREFTVNMYFDGTGCLRCVIPHLRIEVRAGEVSKGVTVRHSGLQTMAEQVAAALPRCRGPLCFQAIEGSDGQLYIIEINARFGGGYPLAHRAGARFTRWLMEERLGLPCSANNDWREGVTMLRYDSAVFTDSNCDLSTLS